MQQTLTSGSEEPDDLILLDREDLEGKVEGAVGLQTQGARLCASVSGAARMTVGCGIMCGQAGTRTQRG